MYYIIVENLMKFLKFTQKKWKQKKKTCACTWCALFSEQVEWENSIESYTIEWRGGNYKVKKRNVCLFHFYFFSYMLRVNNNKSKLTTRVCWRRGKSEIVSAFIWTTLGFFVNTRRHFICLLLENEEIWNIVNFFHTLYSQ